MNGRVLLDIQGVPKKPQTIENNLLLEFQWQSTKLSPQVHKLLTLTKYYTLRGGLR